MQIKLIRIEQPKPNIAQAEQTINKELKKLESRGKIIKDIKMSVVRDAAPEYQTTKSYALTVMIAYD